jgi:hypothetical protein
VGCALASLSPAHIPGCARLGIARLKAFRLNVYERTTTVIIDGAPLPGGAGVGLLIEGAQIVHALNDQVDTAQFTAHGWTPVAGQSIAVYSGDKQLYGGRIVETTSRYLSKAAPANVVHDMHCIDFTWLLSRWKINETYGGVSATAIIKDIIARFTHGFTANNVQAGLPTIDILTFTNEDVASALTTICQMIGAYWLVDYQSDVHVFTAVGNANPISQANPGESGDFAMTEDLSQVATRILGIGGGVGASVDVPAGATELPLDLGIGAGQPQWYPTAGGVVQVGAQRVTYTQLRGNTGRGAILGTGNAPSVAPGLAPTAGAGLGTGTYHYAVTFKTGNGETLIGPTSAVQTGAGNPAINAFSVRASPYVANTTYYPANANIQWRISILYQGGGNSLGPQTGTINTGNKYPEIGVGPIATDPITGHQYPSWLMSRCPAKIVQIVFYRTTNGATTVHVWDVLNGVSEGVNGWLMLTGDVTDADLNLQGGYPAPSGATQNAVTVAVPQSSSPSVTHTTIYRSPVNGSAGALKQVANIAKGTTSYLDAIPDASLGAVPPAIDASQLREDGQIPVGATSALVTDVTPFIDDGGAAGGWVTIGNLPVRYTGISGSNLIGIPTSGSGSVTSTVRYGSQVLVHPRLVGIPTNVAGMLTQGARKGDMVALRIDLQDIDAIYAMAARFGTDVNGGVIELVLNDSRLGPTELLQYVQATLAERKDPRLTIRYWTRDETHDVGKLVAINIATPLVNEWFRIQRVTFSEIAIAGARTMILPKRTIEASNKLYTFSDLLRQIRGREVGKQ